MSPPEPPRPAELDSARDDVAALLAEIERLRPGLVRHRALDLDCGSGALVQALGETFDECDGLSPDVEAVRAAQHTNRHGERCRYLHVGEGRELPFDEETFDLVHCGTLLSARDGGRAEDAITETIRVMRLFGVAVMDVAGGEERRPEPFLVSSASDGLELRLPGSDGLELRLSAPERLLRPAGGPGQLAVTVTNTGAITLGSAINPLRLEGYWDRRRDAASAATEAELGGILLPGDSLTVTLTMSVPDVSGEHVLELSVASPGPWGERRSSATVVVIDNAPPDRPGHRPPADTIPLPPDEPIVTAVAQAGGVVLNALSLEPGPAAVPRRRYFFARA